MNAWKDLSRGLAKIWDLAMHNYPHWMADIGNGDARNISPGTPGKRGGSDMPDINARVQAAQARLEEISVLSVPKQVGITLIDSNHNRMTYKGQDKEGFKYTNRLLARAFRSKLVEGLEEYHRLLSEVARMSQASPMQQATSQNTRSTGSKVVIEVKDGIAECTSAPAGIEVEIVDRDIN